MVSYSDADNPAAGDVRVGGERGKVADYCGAHPVRQCGFHRVSIDHEVDDPQNFRSLPPKRVSAVIVAIMLSLLLGIASLTIDIGMTYTDASAIQNVADAVALSLGRFLPVEDDEAAIAEIIALADEYAAKNGYFGLQAEDIVLGDLVSGRYGALTINLSKTSPTYLAKIIGVEEITSRKSATISAVPAGSVTGCVPVGISASAYETAMATGITEHVVFKAGGGGGESGFFGYIVIDGSNSNMKALLDTQIRA